MDYKKGLVCYISTCTYLKVALGLYKGVMIYYIYLFIYIYLVVLLMKNPVQFKLKNIQLIHPWKFFPIKSSWPTALEDMLWKLLQVFEKYYRVLNGHIALLNKHYSDPSHLYFQFWKCKCLSTQVLILWFVTYTNTFFNAFRKRSLTRCRRQQSSRDL